MTDPAGRTVRTQEEALIIALREERDATHAYYDAPWDARAVGQWAAVRLDRAQHCVRLAERELAAEPAMRRVECELEDPVLDDSDGTIVWTYTLRLPEGGRPDGLDDRPARVVVLVPAVPVRP